MTRFVGLVYGENNKPLYCEENRAGYYVINGDWSFDKNTRYVFGDKSQKLRMVLPEMDKLDYTEACKLIMEAGDDHNNS